MSTDTREVRLRTGAQAETEHLGRALAPLLPVGGVVALRGDLATGKTCLVRGMAAHFDRDAPVHSPTFTLVNEYGAGRKLYHLDLYRLAGPEELADLGYEELFAPEDGVTVVEWAERADSVLPPRRLDIDLAHAGGDARDIVLRDRGLLGDGWQARLRLPEALRRNGSPHSG